MTCDEIITLVLNRCGNRAGSQTLRDAALLELIQIQTNWEETPEPPWFLLSESATTVTIAGDPRVAVPEDFLMEDEQGDLWVQKTDGVWNSLTKTMYDILRNKYQNEGGGLPCQYALRGQYFYLGPTPDAEYTLRMPYFKKQTTPALEVENAWTTYAPDLFIGELGVVMAGQYLSDFNKMKTFETQVVRATVRMRHKNIAREEANQRGQM